MCPVKTLVGLFGAGGFAREVMPVVREVSDQLRATVKELELVFVVEGAAEPLWVNGHRVVTAQEFFAAEVAHKLFNVAIADYRVRQRIAEMALAAGVEPLTIRASNVVCFDQNEIGPGAILCPFVSVTSNAKIGAFFHANIYSYVAHDCVIGDYVTFAPSVHCNGRVVIEDYAYIGTGAVLRQGSDSKPLVIGRGAVVGMGAVVTKSVAPSATVVGNPAREMPKAG